MSASQLTSKWNKWKVTIQKNHKHQTLPRMSVTIFSSTGPFSIRIRSSLERLSMGRIRSTESRMDHVVYQVSSTAIVHIVVIAAIPKTVAVILATFTFSDLLPSVAKWLRDFVVGLAAQIPQGITFLKPHHHQQKNARNLHKSHFKSYLHNHSGLPRRTNQN